MPANGGRSSEDARDLPDPIERVASKQPPSKYRVGFPAEWAQSSILPILEKLPGTALGWQTFPLG
jgi:hypothetical protein